MGVFGFKAFNEDFTCRGFQYEIGETYEIEGELKICENGFHFCKKLKDCFKFYLYEPRTKLAVIEALGEVIDARYKSVTNKIRIVEEISFNNVQNIIKSDKNKLFDIEDGVLKDCFRFVEGDVVIPDGVIHINPKAFCYCEDMTSVTIPDSVTSIGNYAFSDCLSLKSIVIPESVTYIGHGVFDDCSNMESLTIMNKRCRFNDIRYTFPEHITLNGYKRSTLKRYAKTYERKFIQID